MDDVPAEFQSESTAEGSGPHDQSTGAFFPQAQHFVVAGGQFKSITNITHVASTLSSDFRMIPLGDLNLHNEIRLDSGVAYRRWNSTRSVRRMYSARIHGSKAPMTVALYESENAEEEWRQDVSRYSCLRHPNILQLFGTINSSGIHAAIFHDELILAKKVMEKYRGSHLPAVYLWEYFPFGVPIDIWVPFLEIIWWSTTKGEPLSVMESGWTRVNSCELMDAVVSRNFWCDYSTRHGWLTQANHIFNRLGIASNYRDYVLVYRISYKLKLFNNGNSIPSGYLFLCPLADLQSDNPSYFRHPECAAYWSLEPSGVERLGMEAEQLGFPAFEFTVNVYACSWDESVYKGIRQFNQGKGFNPDSLDVALELEYPLYQLSADAHSLFAHVDETDSENEVALITECPPESDEESYPPLVVEEASSRRDDAQMHEPSRATWKIAVGLHLVLIILSLVSQYEYYCL
ncbi:hypothetical protein FB451DRAFT_1404676 [Mycena latifolia]|nr:hypothetical protein FB451DRAFT_1404676 [Mycena latifolia]